MLAGQNDAAAKQQAPELKGLSRWQRKVGVVTHVFTHFPLELTVFTGIVPAATPAPAGMRFTPLAQLGQEPLSGVMVKVLAAAGLKLPPSAP